MPKPLALLTMALMWSAVAVFPGSSEAVKLVGVACIAALLLPAVPRSPGLRVRWAMLLYLLAMAVAALLALEPAAARIGSTARAQGLLTTLAVLVLALTVASVAPADRFALYRRAAWLGSVISVYALAQRVGLDPLSWVDSVPNRPAATLGNANALAGWLILLLPMSALLMRAGGGWRWALPVLLQLSALLASGSRGAVLALLVAGVSLGLWRNRRWQPLLLPIMALMLILGVSLAVMRPASLQDRVYLWRMAAQALVAAPPVMDAQGNLDQGRLLRPWFGYGLDQQAAILASTRGDIDGVRDGALEWNADRAHQGLLDRLLEAGLLGLAATLFLIWAVWRQLWRALVAADPDRRDEAFALTLALAAWLLHLQASFALTGDRSLAWIWIGCALAVGRSQVITALGSESPRQRLPHRHRDRLARAVAAAVLLTGACAAAGALPERWLAQLAPAALADREFSLGQKHYTDAMAAAPGMAAARMTASAEAFERASQLRPYDRDAAFAAASAWVEAAAAGAGVQALDRAQQRVSQLAISSPADPRLPALAARLTRVTANLQRP